MSHPAALFFVDDHRDAVGASEAEALLDRLRATPEVPLRAHNDAPVAFEAARRALVLAGYSPADFL